MKKILAVAISISIALPFFVAAQSILDQNIFSSGKYGFSFEVPKGWIKYESQFKSLKGGDLYQVTVTQVGDLVSRPTKAFILTVGAPDAVFGLRKSVVQQVSHENLIDFFIDQSRNVEIDYTVTKAYIKGTDTAKMYVVESNYLVPGPYRVQTVDYFQFIGENVYHTSETYFASFSNYAPTLQSIVDSMKTLTP